LIKDILNNQFTRYHALQIQDLYKLLHQAALGSEHAVPGEESAWNRLYRELAELYTIPLNTRGCTGPLIVLLHLHFAQKVGLTTSVMDHNR
jgi:hypothetical protein